ncbi:hypothetical protein ALP46_102813 [Pseudomonas amygdali pv. myricae]|nr:hypothetical protein ALP46_102813 [Pseudomonas amygdali pv. myricae]
MWELGGLARGVARYKSPPRQMIRLLRSFPYNPSLPNLIYIASQLVFVGLEQNYHLQDGLGIRLVTRQAQSLNDPQHLHGGPLQVRG